MNTLDENILVQKSFFRRQDAGSTGGTGFQSAKSFLDNYIIESQRQLLRKWRIPVRQIGEDIARKGIKDEEILPFLHQLPRPTLLHTRSRLLCP